MQTVIDQSIINYQIVNPTAPKTFLLLHGWGQNSNHWMDFVTRLPKNYRYLLLDLPGFGQSHLLRGDPGVHEYSDFLNTFITKQEIQNPIIFGHSFGGQVAMYFATKHPKNIAQLLLLSPAGIRTKTKKQKIKNWLYRNFKFLKIILPTFILKRIIQRFTSTDFLNSSIAHRKILNKIVNQDLSYLLKDIKVPTHIIWGDADVEIPYDGKTLAENIPNSSLHVLYGADHNPHIFKPKLLEQTLNDILK